jgi:hypothetical protein
MKEKLGMKSFPEVCQSFGFGPLIEALIHRFLVLSLIGFTLLLRGGLLQVEKIYMHT